MASWPHAVTSAIASLFPPSALLPRIALLQCFASREYSAAWASGPKVFRLFFLLLEALEGAGKIGEIDAENGEVRIDLTAAFNDTVVLGKAQARVRL